MNKIKETYERPTTELLELQLEKCVLTGSIRSNSANSGYDDNNDLGEI